MTRPLSLDLRERIVAGLADGGTSREVARRYDVSVATVVRLGQKWRAGRSLAPAKIGGYRRPILGEETQRWIRQRLLTKRDLTIRALTAELARECGISVTPDTVWRCVRRLGLSYKKNAAGERAGWAEDGALPRAVEDPPA